MKTKIDVYQQKETPIHRWNVYNTFTDTKDKYDLYFKNRYTVKNGWEKYDNLIPLDDDYILYKLYERSVGAQNSIWKTGIPDLASVNVYSQGYNALAAGDLEGALGESTYMPYEKRRDIYSYSAPTVSNCFFYSGPWFFHDGGKAPIDSQYIVSDTVIDIPSGSSWTVDNKTLTWIYHRVIEVNPAGYFPQDTRDMSMRFTIKIYRWGDELWVSAFGDNYGTDLQDFLDSVYTTPSGYFYLSEDYNGTPLPYRWFNSPSDPINGLISKVADVIDGTLSYTPEVFILGYDPETDYDVYDVSVGGFQFTYSVIPIYQSTEFLEYVWNTQEDEYIYNPDGYYKEYTVNNLAKQYNYILAEGAQVYSWNSEMTGCAQRDWSVYRNGQIISDSTDNPLEDMTSLNDEGTITTLKYIPSNEISHTVGDYYAKFYEVDWDLYGEIHHGQEVIRDWTKIDSSIRATAADYRISAFPIALTAGLTFGYGPAGGYPLYFETTSLQFDEGSLNDLMYKVDVNNTDCVSITGFESIHFDFYYDNETNKIEGYAKCVGRRWSTQPIATDYNGDRFCAYNRAVFTGKLVFTQNNFVLNDMAETFTVKFKGYEDFEESATTSRYDKFAHTVHTFNLTKNVLSFANATLTPQTGEWPYGNYLAYKFYDSETNSRTYAWRMNYYEGFNNGYSIYYDTIVEPVEEIYDTMNQYINTDIIDVGNGLSYDSMDLDSLRFGFSYPTEKYFPYNTIYDWETYQTNLKGFRAVVDYTQLQDMYANWYDSATWQPRQVYKLTFPEDTNHLDGERIATYELVNPTHIEYNWHPMGIKPYRYWLKTGNNTVTLQTTYNEENKANYLYEVIFELTEPVAANTFYLLDSDRIKTILLPTFEEPNPNDIYEVNETYQVVKPSYKIKEWKYTTKAEYLASTEERWLTQKIYEFPESMLVPAAHWPEMLYKNKRYKDVEIVSSDEMTYPNLGYYPPKEEMLPDNFKTELEEGQAIYRYIGDINEYYSTVKAGTIYLPVGTDIEEYLMLSQYDIKCENENIETNPYGYDYLGEEEVVNKNALMRVATSEDFGAYPKDGLASDGFWYEYIGTNEEIEYIWTEKELRSNANFNIDVNSNQDFTIGDVAGASFRVDIQGNIRDTIQYLGRKVRLNYDFENQNEFKDFGLFTIEDVKFMNHQVSTITAYDNIKKFDAPVYEYLTSDNVKPLYPMTAKTLFQLMCEYCEVPYYTSMEFLNSDVVCYGAFGDANLTARQVLSYIAELAAGYIVCDTSGYAVIKTHKPYDALENTTQLYTTEYENIIPLLNSIEQDRAEITRTTYLISQQVNQRMDIFPTEVIDSIVFNNADTESFINYRKELNAIYDLSDNPFLAFVDNQAAADEITNGILDQIAILIPPIYDGDAKFYAGEIELKNFDYSTFGSKQVVRLLDEEKTSDFFIPTTISINESGITLEAKGQPKYSTKIVNSELAKQVNSLKMNIKEIKLTIPDALADTLDSHGQQISTIETDLGTVQTDLGAVQEDLGAVQESVSSLDTALETQRTETSTQFTNVQRRDDGQDDRLDGHDTDIAAIQTKNTNQDTAISANTTAISSLTSTVGTNTTNISSLQTTVNGLPTKSYVDNLNQVNSITNGWKLSIGEDEVSFYTDNGYLFISDGTTTWKLKLEVNS